MAQRSLLSTLEQIPQTQTIETVITGLVATTSVYNANAPMKLRVIDCYYVMTQAGGGACTGTLQTAGAAAITDAMNINAGDRDIVRAAEINDANADIAADGTLNFAISAATGVSAGRLYTTVQFIQ